MCWYGIFDNKIVGCENTTTPPIDTTPQCIVDNLCCTAPVSTGLCGINGSCADGQMEYEHFCGSDLTPIKTCVLDSTCNFQCTGSLLPFNKGLICPGDDVGLISDTAYTTINVCSVPGGSPPKCEIECINGFVPQGGTCVCPAGTSEINGQCIAIPPNSGNWSFESYCPPIACVSGGSFTSVGGGWWTGWIWTTPTYGGFNQPGGPPSQGGFCAPKGFLTMYLRCSGGCTEIWRCI